MRAGRRDENKMRKYHDQKLQEKRGKKGKTLTRGKRKVRKPSTEEEPEALLRERMLSERGCAGWESTGGFNDSCSVRYWT
jgi:hypothetical protein